MTKWFLFFAFALGAAGQANSFALPACPPDLSEAQCADKFSQDIGACVDKLEKGEPGVKLEDCLKFFLGCRLATHQEHSCNAARMLPHLRQFRQIEKHPEWRIIPID
jgi:hypothetical protein